MVWAHRPLPEPDPGTSPWWASEPGTVADLSALRGRLRAALQDGGARPADVTDDDVDWLLLAFDELASNGLRHGRVPVRVALWVTGSGWVLDVRDAAPERPPEPAVGRDPGSGGMGLYLVAGISIAHGWVDHGDHKHLWARLGHAITPASPGPADASGPGAAPDAPNPGRVR
jgi:Histidine kinase-like ATPase domain